MRICSTCTSSIYTAAYGQLMDEFHVGELVITLGLSIYVFGLAAGPLFLAPLSEFWGRRPIYIWSFVSFVIFLVPCAVAPHLAVLFVFRFLTGAAGSVFLSVSGGTVGDMFEKHELGAPMMVFTAAPFLGPTLGPLLGGFINQNTNWKWTFYVMIIWSFVTLVLIIVFVKETYHPVMLRIKARHLRKETGKDYYAQIDKLDRSIARTVAISCLRPFQLLFQETMVACLSTFTALILGILYLFFQAFPRVFRGIYGFSLQSLGLSFLGIFVGMIIGVLTDPYWKRQYLRLSGNRIAKGLAPKPEYRLPSAIAGGVLVPVGLFWFAFTQRESVHWIVPIIGSGVFATGTILVYSGVFTFLVEAYPLYAASALGANAFLRSMFAAGFPLASKAMYDNMGNMWASALLAFLSLVMAPFPYLFFRYGEVLRARSRWAIVDPATTTPGSTRPQSPRGPVTEEV